MNTLKRSRWLTTGILTALLAGQPVLADDTELFTGSGLNAPNVQPNILFIIDTSGSMDGQVDTQSPFDPATSWAGTCDPTAVYWRLDTGAPPDCTTDTWFTATSNTCNAAAMALNASGTYTDRFARFNPIAGQWDSLLAADKVGLVECRADAGIHGDGSDPTLVWASDGNAAQPWDANFGNEISWSGPTGNTYTVYSGNYLNWFHNPVTVTQTRLDVVKDVTNSLLDSLTGVNVGLMRFSNNHDTTPEETRAEGGMIIHAMEDVDAARVAMQGKINAFDHDGWTPLSETLYEAGQYFAGRAVDFGVNSAGNTRQPEPSVPESRTVADPTLYQSPIQFDCQKNFVVLLTDGAPTQDTNADTKITGLPNFNTLVGASCDGAGHGACLDDMAEYMFDADMGNNVPNSQNVVTYTIGFTVDLPILASTAARGGGQYFLADDTASLTGALMNIVSQIQQEATTFTAPAVSVNAFNRTQNLNDLYITLFQPSENVQWPGNLKKYRVAGNEIVGTDGTPIVDPLTGMLRDDARSFWPDPAGPIDGANVARGGAANRLPDPVSRNLYTNLGALDLTLPSNQVNTSNAALTDWMFGGGFPGDPSRDDLINFARGADVTDVDGDTDTTEPRLSMGDPLHAKPVAVIYGGTDASPDLDDAVIISATNEGYVHAVDPVTGVERWAFAPQWMLQLQRDRFVNGAAANKQYGIDGNLVAFQIDVDEDGIVEPADGDAVYLFFGQRRGGDTYYALDISSKDAPKYMWDVYSGTPGYADMGQTWSTPTMAKVDVNGTEYLAMIVGGGYDTRQDNGPYGLDPSGNAVYIIDALTGNLLWRAGPDAGADLQLPEMNNSIAARMRVLDMNSDGFADRMYVPDLGGRIWRFDITNGQPRGSLVAGGVIARLGAGGVGGATPQDNRRFHNAIDVALVPTPAGGYLNLGIGSGYRGHPLDTTVRDNFFAVRDPNVFNQLSQAQYNGLTVITFADMIDITGNTAPVIPLDAKGWRLELRSPAFAGEKVLSDSVTFLNTIFFTSFEPVPNNNSACFPSTGINRLYMIDILDGSPVNNLDQSVDPNNLTVDDRSLTLRQGGIAPEPAFLFPDQSNCVGPNCPDILGLVGVETFDPGAFPPFIRTFWFSLDAEQ